MSADHETIWVALPESPGTTRTPGCFGPARSGRWRLVVQLCGWLPKRDKDRKQQIRHLQGRTPGGQQCPLKKHITANIQQQTDVTEEPKGVAGVRGTDECFSSYCREFALSSWTGTSLSWWTHGSDTSVLHEIWSQFFSHGSSTYIHRFSTEDGNSCSSASKSHQSAALGRKKHFVPALSRTGLSLSTHAEVPWSCLIRLQVMITRVWLCALCQSWFSTT